MTLSRMEIEFQQSEASLASLASHTVFIERAHELLGYGAKEARHSVELVGGELVRASIDKF